MFWRYSLNHSLGFQIVPIQDTWTQSTQYTFNLDSRYSKFLSHGLQVLPFCSPGFQVLLIPLTQTWVRLEIYSNHVFKPGTSVLFFLRREYSNFIFNKIFFYIIKFTWIHTIMFRSLFPIWINTNNCCVGSVFTLSLRAHVWCLLEY